MSDNFPLIADLGIADMSGIATSKARKPEMSMDEQRTMAAHLLLERVELKRDIAQLKADLVKRADAFVKLGNLLRSSPHVINLDEQEMTPEQAARAQKFSSEEFDAKRIASLVGELRTKSDRLVIVEQQIRDMGYSPE